MNASLNCTECSAAVLSKKLLERSLRLAEIAELSEKCDLWNPRKHAAKHTNHALYFRGSCLPAGCLDFAICRVIRRTDFEI